MYKLLMMEALMLNAHLVTAENLAIVLDMWHKIFPNETLWCGFALAENCFQKSLHDPYLRYYIHYNGDTPVGISGIYKEDAEPESAWLGWFGVLPEYRRQGFGTKIMDYFIQECRSLGKKYARLYTGAENTIGQKFYEAYGYKGEPYTADHPYDPEELIIYSLSLCNEPVPPWNNRHLHI